jgi:hypothetical protein
MPMQVYYVADALDELDASEIKDILQRLIALGTRKPDQIKVIISSRPLPHIQKVLT